MCRDKVRAAASVAGNWAGEDGTDGMEGAAAAVQS